MIEFLMIQLFPTYAFLKRMEFSTVPFKIQPLDTRLFLTTAPGLYFAGGKIIDLRINIRILFEEIIPHFRL